MIKISFAGYGVNTDTYDVTSQVTKMYADGIRKFPADNKNWGDPSPGHDKCLFIVWQNGSGASGSAVVTEGRIITLP